jgi:hypothetical protein
VVVVVGLGFPWRPDVVGFRRGWVGRSTG